VARNKTKILRMLECALIAVLAGPQFVGAQRLKPIPHPVGQPQSTGLAQPQGQASVEGSAAASPWTPLVLLAEVDALITTSLGGGGASAGHADWLQADIEVIRGVHLLTAIEGMKPPGGGPSSVGFWGGAAWFVVPHLDVRADWVRRSTADSVPTNTFLIQINGYL